MHINQLSNSASQFEIAECLKETYQYYEALQHYIKAIQVNQFSKEYLIKNISINRENVYNKQQNINIRLFQRYQDAIQLYDSVLKKDLNHTDSYVGKAICLLYLGLNDQALNNVLKSLDIKQNGFLGIYAKGLYLYSIEDYQEAMEYFEKALSIYSQDLDSLSGKGDCLRMMNQYEQALLWYEKALSIKSNHVDSLYGNGHCLRMMDQYEQALQQYEQALGINSQQVDSLYGKAFCLFKFGQYQIAYSLLENVNTIIPNNKIIEQLLVPITYENHIKYKN